MITHLKATGFKSLSGFSLDFSPGLNILVGPNGSGKTNIVSLFEFLAYLVETDASEATSKAGGAGAVFRRIGTTYEKQIEIEIHGCCPLQDGPPTRSRKAIPPKLFVAYVYSFVLCFPETRDSVIFSSQRLKMRRTRDFIHTSSQHISPSDWSLNISVDLDANGAPKSKIHKFEEKFVKRYLYVPEPGERLSEVIPKLEGFLNRTLAENVSLVSALGRLGPDFWAISSDISGGQIYNVVPSKIKLPEDSAKPPGIARDGSGLAATLYALQRSKNPDERDEWFYPGLHRRARQFPPQALDQLKAYLRLVNESISGVTVENDPFDNQLRVRFEMKSGGYAASVPLGLMSDGTLKWLALVTAALTNRSVFSVEEPENYLHPEMQAQIVNILREILFQQKNYKFALMTTHSETLLNRCKPEELIIVSFTDGSTKAKRCSNVQEIQEEIQRTGFGLGYYYLTHAIQD